jgi:two-component system phosphate regulon sensor histidine kinase PhoR
MTPRLKTRTLSQTVFSTLLVFSLLVVAAFVVLASLVLYNSYESDAEKTLTTKAEAVASALTGEDQDAQVQVMRQQIGGLVRYTYVAGDGTVLYDSEATGALENHADRPEIKAAQTVGEAVSSRYSQTLKNDLIYAAVRLDDGATIRLAQVRRSYAAYMGGLAVPLAALFVIVIIADFAVARRLTRRIMQPINAIDVDDPLSNEIYEEVSPLLVHIDDQRARMQEQNEALAAAENMRREFSANVSHEMKTPLTVISGYAELMKNDMVQPQDRRHFAELIFDEAQKMRSLIDDVLTISRLEEFSFAGADASPVDLLATAQSVAKRLEAHAREQGVDVSVRGDAAFILGSPVYCEQMLYNLVDNGIRYNCSGGHVKVTTCVDDEGRAVVKVADDGVGIAPDQQDKVFERFYRVDASRSKQTGGTGLGLAIVKHAVQYQGGTIEVHSSLGAGTTFELTFPTVEDRRAALARRA